MKSPRALRAALRKIGAVPLSGTAVRLVDEKWSLPEDVISGEGARTKGGRYNAPGSFRAVYLTENAEVGLVEIGFPISAGGQYALENAVRVTVVPVRFRLARALNLCDYEVRIRLGTDADEIKLPLELFEAKGQRTPTQILGHAVFKEGWSAIQYPSRHDSEVCNLVVFPDNLSEGEYLHPQKPKRQTTRLA